MRRDDLETEQEKPELQRGASPRAFTAATEIYTRWEAERERTPLDRVVGAEFRSRRYLNSSERRWIAAVVYDSVRYLRRLTTLLHQHDLPDTPENRLRLGIDEGVPAFRRSGVPENASPLQSILTPQHPNTLTPNTKLPERRDALREILSFPDVMAEELEALLGTEAIEAGEAFNRQAPTTLRVNTLRTTRANVEQRLPEATPTRYSPWGLELPKRVNIFDLPGFREGHFEIQEEASQLAALLTDAQPGQTVVDVGAGAGGKTLALAALMQNHGRIVALDTSPVALNELDKRAARAGVGIHQSCLLTADEAGLWQLSGVSLRNRNRLLRTADCVLLDAPCSGSGVIRRSPDAKWRSVDSAALERLQQNLLLQGCELVAPGGVFIYVTCAFERSQDEAIVERFLESPAGREFILEPVLPRLQAAFRRTAPLHGDAPTVEAIETDVLQALVTGPYLRTWPHRHGLDSFFAACLRRTGKA
jgi:16S rRNA (cytosine967-C5)-methyltransferase